MPKDKRAQWSEIQALLATASARGRAGGHGGASQQARARPDRRVLNLSVAARHAHLFKFCPQPQAGEEGAQGRRPASRSRSGRGALENSSDDPAGRVTVKPPLAEVVIDDTPPRSTRAGRGASHRSGGHTLAVQMAGYTTYQRRAGW